MTEISGVHLHQRLLRRYVNPHTTQDVMKKSSRMPSPGDRAPNFEGVIQNGESIRLSDYAGHKVALYFYPKDNTSGCTKQACSIRDGSDLLEEAGIKVIGVSGDPVESHGRFAGKHNLSFPLVADPDRKILEQYGVWGEKSMYGRKYMGTHRTTFLIDENGVIRDVIRKPKVNEHAEEIIAAFG